MGLDTCTRNRFTSSVAKTMTAKTAAVRQKAGREAVTPKGTAKRSIR